MKTMFRTVTIIAALTCAGAIRTLAQDEPPSPPSPPPPPVAIMHDVQDVAEGAVHKAQADVENQMRQVQNRLSELKDHVFRLRRKSDKSLVVRSSDMAPRAQSDLEEDMTIMTHILDKAVAERSDDQAGRVAMGINVSFVPGEGPTRSIYVDGYGALFFLNVNFPLLPPPVEKNVEKEKAPGDSAWEEAKEEVYGQPGEKSWSSGPQVEYDAAKVADLTNAVLNAVKNAANIRSVRSDESITVCVVGAPLRGPARAVSYRIDSGDKSRTGSGFGGGGGGFSGGGGAQGYSGPRGGGGGGGFGAAGGSGGGGGFSFSNSGGGGESGQTFWVSNGNDDDAPGNRTTLTIRVKKADCVAFANGKLTAEEFRRRAVITIYGDPEAKP